MSATAAFLPFGDCVRWQPVLLWLQVNSDAVIAAALLAIAVMLAVLVARRRDTPYRHVYLLVALFIVCGALTQVVEIIDVWFAAYWVDGILKALTAVAAIATVVALAPLLPKLTSLPNPIVDGLTALPNRILLLDRIGLAIARMKRENREMLAVLCIDLDGFKSVNDSLGHALGDALLVRVGKRLTRAVRAVDTVSRIGGDEFVILLERIDGPLYAKSVARRILSELERPFPFGEVKVQVGATIGIVVSSGEESAEQILNAADAAMYGAKITERGSFGFSDRSLREAV